MNRAWNKVRASLTVDWGLFSPVAGAITALPVVAIFAVGLGFGSTRAAISMAIGADLIAIISLVGAPRLPISIAFVDAFALGFTVFVGSVTEPYPWLHAVVLIPWCFGAGLLVCLGATQATVGAQAIVAFVALGRYPGTPLAATHLGVLVLAGAVVEITALFVLRLPPSLRYQRNHLADIFAKLAELAQRDPHRVTHDVATALDNAEQTFKSLSLFGRTDARVMQSALNQARRMQLEFTNVAGLRTRISDKDLPDGQSAIDICLAWASRALLEIGEGFRHPTQTADWISATAAFDEALLPLDESLRGSPAQSHVIARQCVIHLLALAGQMRAAGSLMDELRASHSRQVWRPSLVMLRDPNFEKIRMTPGLLFDTINNEKAILLDNLQTDSPAFRHAVRFAIAVPLSAFVASWLSLPRGYWLPFSVAVILRPDYSTLLTRGLGRVIGTLLGATLAAVLVSEIHPDLFVTTVFVGLTAWAAYATWSANFAVSIGFVTALVLILLSTSLTDTVTTALDRLIDVSLGGVIAVMAYLVWPTSQRVHVSEIQSELFAALRDYLAIVLELVRERPVDTVQVSRCAKGSRQAWAKAEEAVRMSIDEPASTRIDPVEGLRLLANTMRIVRAIHALRIGAERGTTVASSIELNSLCTGLVDALDALSTYLSTTVSQRFPDLRQRYLVAQRLLVQTGAPSAIALHIDELVNAIDTAAHILGQDRQVKATG